MLLDIVFEDEHLIVVDKPAGLVVHPAAGNWSGTLLNGLLAHHAGACTLPRAGIVHRLDKDTSGLMVVGKTLVAVTALVRQIASRDVRRIYVAVCHGRFDHHALRIEAPIGRDPRSRVRMAVVSSGRSARTDVERLALLEGPTGEWLSAVRCSLHTGRTHQIRVHLASVGHPLLADKTYGGREGFGMTRQALHATRLGFEHPVDGRPMAFERDPPADLASVWGLIAGAD
jgi:23S rRNA pseudouridine1911/1915/1917 synthase